MKTTEMTDGSIRAVKPDGEVLTVPADVWEMERVGLPRIEMIAQNGDATVQVKGHEVKVTRDEYAVEGVKVSPTERDAAIMRAAQYKLNYGDE